MRKYKRMKRASKTLVLEISTAEIELLENKTGKHNGLGYPPVSLPCELKY